MIEKMLREKPTVVSFMFLITLVVFVVAVGVWFNTGNLEESITAFGQMVPEGKLKRVMSPSTGIVANILVEENQIVKAGDVVIELDPEFTQIDAGSLDTQYTQLQTEANALQSALDSSYETDSDSPGFVSFSNNLYGQYQSAWLMAAQQSLRAELKTAEMEIERLNHELKEAQEKENQFGAMLANSKKLLIDYTKLHEQGGLARNELTRFKQVVIEQEGQLKAVRETIAAKKVALGQAKNRPEVLTGNYRQSILDKLTDLQERIVVLDRDRNKNEVAQKHQKITAPVDGIVHELAVRGQHEIVQAGDTLISIVPSDMPLVAEVKVPNMDLSYIHQGQDAALRLDAFPFQTFGRVDGQVISISPSTVTDEEGRPYYLIRIRPDKNGFEDKGDFKKIKSGMTLTADLITRHKNILSFFTEPVFKHVDKAMRDPSTR